MTIKNSIYLLLSALVCTNTSAGIISSTGDIEIISAPTSVQANTLESDSAIRAFDEAKNYLLTEDLMVDMLGTTGAAGSIIAGNRVDSTLLHFDPIGNTSGVEVDALTLTGSITFNMPILGVIWSGVPCAVACPAPPALLDFSDYLGASGTTYGTGEIGRGLEFGDYYDTYGTTDNVTLFTDELGIAVLHFSVKPKFTDQLRIITAARSVPEPGSIILLATGLMGLFGIRHRKNS
jgi:hypothetical protein